MDLTALLELSNWINSWVSEYECGKYKSDESEKFAILISNQHSLNNWHTEQDIVMLLTHFGKLLNHNRLKAIINKIPCLETRPSVLVMPNANYSFAGFFEWLGCVVTRTPFVLNAEESQYQVLKFFCLKFIEQNKSSASLFDIKPKNTIKCEKYIIHSEVNDTVSQYFKNKKSLMVEPRSTIGIITGHETPEEIVQFGKDIFIHLGQSPRSLRKLYIPLSFDIKKIIAALEPFSYVYRYNKYANNYDYHQSVFLMNRITFLDNGFLIFKEDTSDDAPTGCLFYEYYEDISTVEQKIKDSLNIENVICKNVLNVKTVKPGESHFFSLDEYFNGKDLVGFLLD